MTAALSSTLAHHVISTRYEDLSPGAREAAKKSLLDALGVSLGASGLGEGCAAFATMAIESGGRPESAIFGYSAKAPAHMAAFANGSMAHALDFEDAFDGAPVHSNAAVVPAALAVAQAIGGVSGRELLLALAIGCDLVCRLGLALTTSLDSYGWYPPPILSAFGAAAAAARLLRLTETQVLDAFSLVLCQATCSAELKYSPQSVIRAVRDAFPAQAGVVSAQLAQKGVSGFEEPFEGKAGFFAAYARGNYDPQVVLRDLGRDFLGERVSFKPWPACRGTHAFIESALKVAAGHALDPAVIDAIHLVGAPIHRMLSEPAEQKRRPVTAIDAKFSLPFTVSTALVHREVRLEHFFPHALADSRVLALTPKVSIEINPEADSDSGVTTIRTRAGAVFSASVEHALGHPENPIGLESLVRKFMECAGHAHHALKASSLQGIVDTVASLETVQDAGRDLIEAHLG